VAAIQSQWDAKSFEGFAPTYRAHHTVDNPRRIQWQQPDLRAPAAGGEVHDSVFVPDIPEPDRVNLMARWLFRGTRMHLAIRALPGDGCPRVALACLLHAEPASQLLLFDEPTNTSTWRMPANCRTHCVPTKTHWEWSAKTIPC
jgi:hypothetical protein